MEALQIIFQSILDMGAAVFLPIVIFIIGLVEFCGKHGRTAYRAGYGVGAGSGTLLVMEIRVCYVPGSDRY